jgi:hypothetical protein
MSEPSANTRNPEHGNPASSSGPVFIFNGPVYGFYYEASPQGNLVGCLMTVDPSSTSPSSKSIVSLFEFSQQSIGNARSEEHQTHGTHPQAAEHDVPRGTSASLNSGLDQSFFDGDGDVQDPEHMMLSIGSLSTG